MRVHVVMPDELVAEIDARVGKRGRSRFVTEAIEDRLRRQRALEAFDEFAGSLADVDIPGWETPESAAQWVRDMRYHPERLVDYLSRLDNESGPDESTPEPVLAGAGERG
jgi:hypothetical protein